MTLAVSTLITELRKIVDNAFEQFDGFPQTDAEAAARWASAYAVYMRQISNPPPTPASLAGIEAGRAAMQSALTGMSVNGAAVVLFPVAFAAFATSFAATTAPYVSVPPPSPLVLPLTPTPDGLVSATAMATAIDLWTRSGTTVLPPATVPTPWL